MFGKSESRDRSEWEGEGEREREGLKGDARLRRSSASAGGGVCRRLCSFVNRLRQESRLKVSLHRHQGRRSRGWRWACGRHREGEAGLCNQGHAVLYFVMATSRSAPACKGTRAGMPRAGSATGWTAADPRNSEPAAESRRRRLGLVDAGGHICAGAVVLRCPL